MDGKRFGNEGGRVNEKGMTLLELLVVIAIIATIMGIVMLSTRGLRQVYVVKGAAREVFGDMQRARLAAIREGRTYTMCFAPLDGTNTTDRVFTSYFFVLGKGADGNYCTSDDPVPDKWPVLDVEKKYPGMVFVENFSGTLASFNPNGKASAGNVKISGSETDKQVSVNGNTGNIRIE